MQGHIDFSQGLLGRIKVPHNCISKNSCLQMFCKGRSSYKFRKIHRKTPVLEFLCNKVAGLEPLTLFILKNKLQHKCLPLNFGKFIRSPTFVENLQGAAFGNALFQTLLNDCFYISENLTFMR